MNGPLVINEARFEHTCSRVFDLLRSLPGALEPRHTGLVMTLALQSGPHDGGGYRISPILHRVFGVCDDEKVLLYRYYSLRKLMQLLEHPEHVSSQQSANPDPESVAPMDCCYGGGIRFKFQDETYLFSASGLPWKCDEAFCVVMSWLDGCINEEEVKAFQAASGNERIQELQNAYFRTGM